MKDRIKHLRKEVLGMSLAKFGEKIGLSPQGLSEIEKGRNVLTERNFDAICKAYHVNPDWLRDGVGEIFFEPRETIIQSVVEEFELNASETALIRAYLELPPEHRKGVMEFARNFVKNLVTVGELDIEYPAQEEEKIISRKTSDKTTAEEKRAIMNRELDEVAAAEKRGALTSVASITTSGLKRKLGKSP